VTHSAIISICYIIKLCYVRLCLLDLTIIVVTRRKLLSIVLRRLRNSSKHKHETSSFYKHVTWPYEIHQIRSIQPRFVKLLTFRKPLWRCWINEWIYLSTTTANLALLHFYQAVIRPVLEYVAPVWHHLLTKCQADQIEEVHKRALNIIFASTYGMPYHNALFIAGLTSLASRREQLARNFFNSTVQPTSCLHYLLPPPRDPELLTRLRAPTKFPRSTNRTKKYQSSIRYGLSKFQTG